MTPLSEEFFIFFGSENTSFEFDSNIKNNTEAADQFIKECSEKFGLKLKEGFLFILEHLSQPG